MAMLFDASRSSPTREDEEELVGQEQAKDRQDAPALHRGSSQNAVQQDVSQDEDDNASSGDDSAHELGSRAASGKRSSTLSKSYTEDEEKAVLRKIDRKLILFLGFLYMLSFLDRSNIGNARIAGLEPALRMTGEQFDWCLVAFYITYITFEWMILLYRLVPAHIYISLCVFSWGLIASLQSVVTSFSQLLVLRSLLGVGEAAFGPGVPFYMTFFLKRSELAYRVGLQISAAPLATSFASSLAWVIVKLSQNGPIEPWRALFLFEGFPSLVVAIFAWYYIPDSPETARFLTPRERRVAKLRLQEEHRQHQRSVSTAEPYGTTTRGISRRDLFSTLLSPLPWLQALMFLSVNVSFASLPVFLPTIINSMSFSPLTSQILAAPPYLVAFGFVLFIGHKSDKVHDSRSYFLAGVALLSSISYALVAIAGRFHTDIGEAGSITLRYISVYGAAMGLFSAVTLIITWNLNNQASSTGKGMAMVILNVVGQCGPLIGVKLFPDSDGPLYVRGMAICSGFMAGVALLAMTIRLMLSAKNRSRHGNGGDDDGPAYELVNGAQDSRGNDAVDPEEVVEAEGLITQQQNLAARSEGSSFRYML